MNWALYMMSWLYIKFDSHILESMLDFHWQISQNCVSKMNESLMGLERHEFAQLMTEFSFSWTNPFLQAYFLQTLMLTQMVLGSSVVESSSTRVSMYLFTNFLHIDFRNPIWSQIINTFFLMSSCRKVTSTL